MSFRQRRPSECGHGTELLRAEESLRRSQREVEYLRGIVEAMPLGLMTIDDEGRVTVLNQSARVGGGHAEVLVREAAQRAASAGRSGRASTLTVELFGPPARVVEVSAHTVGDEVAVLVHDVSERFREDVARTDFVANVSHELKTPVSAMAVLAEALQDEDDLAVMRRLAGRLVDEAHRAASVIEDQIELSRIELCRDAVAERICVDDLIADALDRTRELACHREVSLRVGASCGGALHGDPRQLLSALVNLVENATKYSSPGSEVTVSAQVVDGMVQIDVIDRGIGIPSRDLPRIFERFYRVDRARRRDTGGTGLGLAIVSRVAANHHGDIRVSSVEGEGSTFSLRLPVAP